MDLTGGDNGGAWFAPLPRCPAHGEMRHRTETRPAGGGILILVRGWWACPGWDGEGCGYTVEDDDLDWTPAGTVSTIQLEVRAEGIRFEADHGCG